MRLNILILVFFSLLFAITSCRPKGETGFADADYAGSESCIQCHQHFYDLWSPSHHGKAMQPVNAHFIETAQIPESSDFSIEGKKYHVEIGKSTISMKEMENEKENNYEVTWALGGKNVYYFLSPLEDGKLQTIPLAYDVNKKAWYNNPESAMRHFPQGVIPDEALPWKDRQYTFNTSCYSCHVSQLKNNYDPATDSYQSTWKEPGINCETCHGPASEHVKIFQNLKEGESTKNLGLISTKVFTNEQQNWACAPCHAKMHPITSGYMPGDRFFDNYNLTGLEDNDFYPDGRDLGENYTYTGWMMNECNQSGQINCVLCHTSSGRNRFKDNPNDACKKCHEDKVQNVIEHSGHAVGSSGAICINCHMPKTEFGKMVRSDHSFRPPMPEATIKFGSPNACNICHTDKTPEWANQIVKKRKNGNYQEETLLWAEVLNEARLGDWKNADKIFKYIQEEKLNEVVTASFVRLLNGFNNEKKWPILIGALNSKSPMVRSSAASGLIGDFSDEAKMGLLQACNDEYKVVRIAAAASLSALPTNGFSDADKQVLAKATEEYINSIVIRADDWSSHYNLGLYYQNQGENSKALDSYETANRLYPDVLMPLINSSVIYSYVGNPVKAEENLQKAISVDPDNEAANLNLGLLLAEQGRMDEAAKALATALKANPKQAVAAYNLSVISAAHNLQDALNYAQIATESNPNEPKYAYTLAYYQFQNNQKVQAEKTLKTIIKTHPEYLTAVGFLSDIYIQDGKKQDALKLYQDALKNKEISDQDRAGIQKAINSLQQNM